MSRPLCAVVLLSCLSSRLESRTVSPDLYVTTDAAWTDRGHRHYGGGASSEPATNRYGHRRLPAGSVVRRGRHHDGRGDDDGQIGQNDQNDGRRGRRPAHRAPYESPSTYAYMNGKGRRSGVPETERRPPGADDVELIGDSGRGDKQNKRRTSEPDVWSSSNNGDLRGGGTVVVVQRKNEHAEEKKTVEKTNGKKKKKKKKKKKNKKKKKKKKEEKKKMGTGGGDDVTAAAHEVHEKNEYSKKQQFFDEEHVNRGGKKPAGGDRPKDHQLRRGARRKRPLNSVALSPQLFVVRRPTAYGQIVPTG